MRYLKWDVNWNGALQQYPLVPTNDGKDAKEPFIVRQHADAG